jgi:MATE family multidrug resistance protein
MKPYLDILRLVWPLAFGMVNNALMQFVDRAFLARDSMTSLEAVLPASMLSLIVVGFFQAIVAYSGTFVANYHGAGNPEKCVLSYRVGCAIAAVFGVVSLLFIPLGGIVFEFAQADEGVVGRSKAYYTICTAGGVLLYAQMASQAFFTGRGKTKCVFAVSLLGNIVNIALDPILIYGWLGLPRLGISGAAYATVAATFVQWVALSVLARRDIRRMDVAVKVRLDEVAQLVRGILRFGVSSGGYSVLNLLSFTIFVFYTGRVGHLEAALSNACFAVNYLLFAPIEGFALGASTLVAQAKGAGDVAEARLAGWRTAALATAMTVILLAATLLFHREILSVFAPESPQDAERFLSLGFELLVLMAAWQIFEVFDTVISGALKGAGDTAFVMWWMLVNSFVLWIPSVAAVSRFCNTMPALWGTMIAYVAILSAGSLWRWHRGSWQRIRLEG